MVKLSICLPTYNRAAFCRRQVDFFLRELRSNPGISARVEFIVSDNASTDDTVEVLRSFRDEGPLFSLFVNHRNLGLVGNIISLLDRACGEYVWFVSDDDDLEEGVLGKVFEILDRHSSLSFLFLNYFANGRVGFIGANGYHEDGKKVALDCFDEAYGSLVFMTACIHRSEVVRELKSSEMFRWIGAPMLYSFYSCSRGPVYFSELPLITFNPGNASYRGLIYELNIKFNEYVKILEFLPESGYSVGRVRESLKGFFQSQCHAYFLYCFVRPLNALSLIKYFSFKAIMQLPMNIKDYFQRGVP